MGKRFYDGPMPKEGEVIMLNEDEVFDYGYCLLVNSQKEAENFTKERISPIESAVIAILKKPGEVSVQEWADYHRIIKPVTQDDSEL